MPILLSFTSHGTVPTGLFRFPDSFGSINAWPFPKPKNACDAGAQKQNRPTRQRVKTALQLVNWTLFFFVFFLFLHRTYHLPIHTGGLQLLTAIAFVHCLLLELSSATFTLLCTILHQPGHRRCCTVSFERVAGCSCSSHARQHDSRGGVSCQPKRERFALNRFVRRIGPNQKKMEIAS